jgi:hypothetical protein
MLSGEAYVAGLRAFLEGLDAARYSGLQSRAP